jgi:putative ABC transport system permease protein
MSRLWQDVTFEMRLLVKSPVFTSVAVVTLALGIGVNTALFSIANFMLSSVPGVEVPDRLVQVWGQIPKQSGSSDGTGFLSYLDYFEYRQATDVFDLAAEQVYQMKASWNEETGRTLGDVVSGNFFDVMGVKVARGRAFTAAETEGTNGPAVTIISHMSWQRRFLGQDVLGKTVKLNGQPFTIVGIAPEDFNGLVRGAIVEFFVPTSAHDQLFPANAGALAERGRAFWLFTGRLRPGVSVQQAEARIKPIAERLATEFPQTNRGLAARVFPLTGNPEQQRGFLFVIGAFMVFGFLVLLIACANVCNLLLARAQARHREMAIRSALGAGRGRLVRQLLTEGIVLAAVGGALGLLMAVWTNRIVMAWWSADAEVPLQRFLVVDGRTLGYTVVLLVVATVAFGLLPALRLSSLNLVDALKTDGGAARGSRRWLSGALVIGQVSAAFVLLIISGLLVRSMNKARNADLGFDPKNLLVGSIDLSLESYPRASWPTLFQDLQGKMAALPGVESACVSEGLPLIAGGGTYPMKYEIDGVEGPQHSNFNFVDEHYLSTLRLAVVEGRNIQADDDLAHHGVALVSQSLAKQYFPGRSPVGRRLRPDFIKDPDGLEIVGVIPDIKAGDFREPSHLVLLSVYQTERPDLNLLLRTKGEPTQWASAMRGVVKEVSPEMSLFQVGSYERQLRRGVFFIFEVGATFAFALALLALVLAIVGLYGVIAFGVSQKTREVGVRMALGAEAAHVLWLFIRRGLILTGIGLVAGLAVALALGRVISTFLYGVSSFDGATFVIVPAVLLVVAIAASYLPARRATQVDPMIALRAE